jgi:hypothetical protein
VTHYTFEWIEDGAFMLQKGTTEVAPGAPQIWHDNAPTTATVVIGRDDRSGRYGYLYRDSREVHRIYEMSLEDGTWRIWGRAGENFFQRFAGTFSEDGQRIAARWERSEDAENWELDFDGVWERVG